MCVPVYGQTRLPPTSYSIVTALESAM